MLSSDNKGLQYCVMFLWELSLLLFNVGVNYAYKAFCVLAVINLPPKENGTHI